MFSNEATGREALLVYADTPPSRQLPDAWGMKGESWDGWLNTDSFSRRR